MIKQFYFKQFTSEYVIVCIQFKYQTVLFDPLIESYQRLPLSAKVDMGLILMVKG